MAEPPIDPANEADISSRYRGSLIGLAWSFINPILLLLVYTFVFSVIFKSRWGTDPNESRTDFAIILFAGMIVFNLFSEIVNRAPGLVISNVNYVKKVVFPLEILPWVALGSALFHTMISLFVLLLVQFSLLLPGRYFSLHLFTSFLPAWGYGFSQPWGSMCDIGQILASYYDTFLCSLFCIRFGVT
jgi:lipopolysaccharide transport system permease protein